VISDESPLHPLGSMFGQASDDQPQSTSIGWQLQQQDNWTQLVMTEQREQIHRIQPHAPSLLAGRSTDNLAFRQASMSTSTR